MTQQAQVINMDTETRDSNIHIAAQRVIDKKKFLMKKDYEEKKIRVVMVVGNAYKEEQRLKANGVSFILSRTNVTTKFKFTDVKRADMIFSQKRFSYKELNLFREINREVKYNIEQKNLVVPDYSRNDVGYYLFSDTLHQAAKTKQEQVFTDIIEFDIVKAYYQAARNLGYISNEFYTQCIELPKQTRLRLIGSIATSKIVFTYVKGKLTGDPYKKEDQELRKAWFHICKYVDACMRDLRNLMKEDFLFYWVDGIYCRNTDAIDNYIMYASLKYGFDFEYKTVNKITAAYSEAKKCVLISAYKEGQDPAKPTNYFLNNDGMVIKELKEFYLNNIFAKK